MWATLFDPAVNPKGLTEAGGSGRHTAVANSVGTEKPWGQKAMGLSLFAGEVSETRVSEWWCGGWISQPSTACPTRVSLDPPKWGFWLSFWFPFKVTRGTVNPRLINPWLINRGCPLLVGIHHFWREHPPNNGTGLLILGQHHT